MFPDIGGTEYLIIFMVALLVFKPQDLPAIAKRVGQFLSGARRMASDFRASFDDMARQSELDQLRKEVDAMRAEAVKATSDPVGSLTDIVASTASDINQAVGDPAINPIYDPAAWMGEDLVNAGAAPEPPTEAPPPAPKPRKPRAKKAAT